jgi:hypothetical protein
MTQRSLSLMDVLMPPGNDWLAELSRRKTDLPPGVHIVRFGDGDDDLAEEDANGDAKAGRRNRLAA